ncbi:MAG: type transport system permease protein [Chthoniobacter sp.]|nr:type transport system permease protein [Chthoniobacter sp.]
MSLFLPQLRGELRKLFARKRTYIGFGAFLVVEIIVLVLFQLPKVQRSYRHMIEQAGYGFEEYFSGLTLAFLILTSTIFLLGALYLALVAGDVVSKEVEEGTMRMMLCRPVSRMRMLAIKYLACVIYTFALIFFIGLTALAAGIARQGYGGLFVFAPLEGIFALYERGPGLARYLGALPLLGLSLLAITSLGFTLSCFNMKPAAATIVTLTLFFVDFIFKGIPYFESLRGWFLTAHMATWTSVFRPHIPWPQMAEDYAYLLAVDLTLVIIGMVNFQQRDFKS